MDEHLKRVTGRIEGAIVEFAGLTRHRAWHADDLRRHVSAVVGVVSPASPDRVLRQLRQARLLNYRVISRSQSLYEWAPLDVPAQMELPHGS